MGWIYYVFWVCITASVITGLWIFKSSPTAIKFFIIAVLSNFITDIISAVMGNIYIINPFIIYHMNIPAYYLLTGSFFYFTVSSEKMKKIILVSMMLFIAACIYFSFFFYTKNDFPGIQLNIMGILLIALCSYTLLMIEPLPGVPLFRHPLIWICLSTILFFSGIFLLNGIYNYLVESKSPERRMINFVINNGLNCIMYTSFAIAFYCIHQLKKLGITEFKA